MGAKLLDVKAGGRQFVDRYELIGEIASGGMATVFLARLTGVGGFQRLFAVKRLHPHLQGEKEFVEMFLDEARLAAGIHHPNVVPILEVGASQNAYYLVMEYIEGETLARLLAQAAARKERLPVPQVLRMALDTLSGLHAAHELRDESGGIAGVVHRDVSPQNVLVGADGVSRITDFGVARAASRLTATRVGQLKGKIAYMAPEQARGDENIDRRADVFAAGVVFWEALAHRRLFKAANEAATLSRVLHDPLPNLREAAPHVSTHVAAVIMKALERDVSRRISTCAEFADALERAAMTSGELGSPRDVQHYMDKVLGGEIRAQREAVRTWVSYADSQVGPAPVLTPTGGASAPGVETYGEGTLSAYQARPGKKWGFVVVLAALALGAFFGYRSFSAQESAPVAPPTAEVPSKTSAPTGSPAPAASSSPSTTPKDEDVLPLADVIEEGAGDDTPRPNPAPRPSPEAAPTPHPAPAPAPDPGPAPATKPKPKPGPLDVLDSNPYR